jgi:hypothetical protein
LLISEVLKPSFKHSLKKNTHKVTLENMSGENPLNPYDLEPVPSFLAEMPDKFLGNLLTFRSLFSSSWKTSKMAIRFRVR